MAYDITWSKRVAAQHCGDICLVAGHFPVPVCCQRLWKGRAKARAFSICLVETVLFIFLGAVNKAHACSLRNTVSLFMNDRHFLLGPIKLLDQHVKYIALVILYLLVIVSCLDHW